MLNTAVINEYFNIIKTYLWMYILNADAKLNRDEILQ